MKVILAIVTSVDGKSTSGSEGPRKWASKEDQIYFSSLIKKHKLIVMGKNTYLVNKSIIKPSKDKLRIVMTRDPQKFKKVQVPGRLEFRNEPPKQFIKRLKEKFNTMLLVSGASLNTAFFKEKLINELWLTLEPKIFGLGKGLVDQVPLNVNLKLKAIKKLNPQGTLLLKYDVL